MEWFSLSVDRGPLVRGFRLSTAIALLWGVAISMLVISTLPSPRTLLAQAGRLSKRARQQLITYRGGRRNTHDAFHRELPQACELLAGAIQAGSSLRQALVQVAAFSSPILSREFREILRLTQFGHSMDTAFERWSETLGSAPAMDMAFCIRLSVQSGGGLSEALKRFAEALRQELVLAEKMRALTSQGRLQALVMLAIPVLLGGSLILIDPTSVDFFLTTWQGWVVMGVVCMLEISGALWIRQLVRVEV